MVGGRCANVLGTPPGPLIPTECLTGAHLEKNIVLLLVTPYGPNAKTPESGKKGQMS